MVSNLDLEAVFGLALDMGEEALPIKAVLSVFDGIDKEDLIGQLMFILHYRVKPGRYNKRFFLLICSQR